MKSYIKQIKSANSKEQLEAITYDAVKASNITPNQFDKLLGYAVCREIELGIWKYLPKYTNKEIALKEAQKEYKIKY